MAVDYTTTALVEQLKRISMLPTSENTFLAAGYIALMNRRLLSTLVPYIMKTNSELFVTPYDITLVADQESYALPDRAISDKLRALCFEDVNGDRKSIEQIDVGQIEYYYNNDTTTASSNHFGIYIINNKIYTHPTLNTVSSGDKLSIHYYRRPNYLIETSAACCISSINRSTGVISMTAAVPSTISSGGIVDFIENEPPFKSLSDDITISAKGTDTLTFTASDIPTDAEAGDYVCLRGESPILQIPWEYHSILAHMGAIDALIAIKDFSKAKALKEELKEMLDNMASIMVDRIEDKPKKIKNFNSFLR